MAGDSARRVRAWAAKDAVDRAIRLLEGVPWRIELVAQSSNFNAEWLQVRVHLAQLYRKVGRDREGEAVDTQLLKLLAVADGDHPIRRRATARLAASVAKAAPARSFNARDWVLVADTDNRTDAALDDAIRFALEQELSASSVVRVVSRPRIEDVLQLMRRPFDTRLAPAVAREVAVREGAIRAVLLPRLSKVGATFTLAVDIVRPADGAVVDGVTDTSLARIDAPHISRIALRVRERLGETIASIEPASEKLDAVATQWLRSPTPRSPSSCAEWHVLHSFRLGQPDEQIAHIEAPLTSTRCPRKWPRQ